MLNKNYYAIVINSTINKSDGAELLTKFDGTTYSPNELGWDKIRFSESLFGDILFGTGRNPPTFDDFKLSGEEITTIKIQNTTFSYSKYSDGVKCIRSMFIQNIGSETITIGEVGWTTGILRTSNNLNTVLLDRTILDEPLTLLAGESGQINYSIYFHYGS